MKYHGGIGMQRKRYDVVVVGSGAAGGTLAAHLARAGVDVAVVEGGPAVNTRTDFNTHALPFHFPNRHIPVMKPGKQGFDSERSRGLGGKTMLWNAVALRFSQRDFKGRAHDDAGEDWPIDYKDLAPHYDELEREVGVCGNRDGLQDLPDGIFLPPAPLKCSDVLIQRGAAELGIPIIHVRKATLTRDIKGRPACHYCGNCMAGCDVVAKYNSYDVHMRPLVRSGRLDLLPNSVVREVVVSDENQATGVRFVNRTTLAEGEVRGRCVVVACACVQSVALLLMSKSRLYPTGLGNSSGQVGRHFIPHMTGGLQCFLEPLIGKAATNDEGFLDHAYMPSFMHDRKRGYARSFGAQFNFQSHRAVGWARQVRGMGASFKQAVKDRYPAYLVFRPYGEKLPDRETYIDLDPEKKDGYGLPLARRHINWTDQDMRLFHDMMKWSHEILQRTRSEILSVATTPQPNHELGGCRMGPDPGTSVVDASCRSHDVPNLYVVDGSVFPSASEKNPTLTMMALAARAADHIAERLRKGEL